MREIRASQSESPQASRPAARHVDYSGHSSFPLNSSRRRQRIFAVVTDVLNCEENDVLFLVRSDALRHRFEELATAFRALVSVFLVENELRDWNDTDPWLHCATAMSVNDDCSDFCSDPTCKRPHLHTSAHTLTGRLSLRLSIE